MERVFTARVPGRKVLKFVVAAGAASRMFQPLSWLLDKPPPAASVAETGENGVQAFIEGLKEFAFYGPLEAALASQGLDLEALRLSRGYGVIVRHLLGPEGLNYGNLPKALILYHSYPGGPRTALEEHLLEAAGYARGEGNVVRVHFAVSPEHMDAVRRRLLEIEERLSGLDVRFDVTLSVQKDSTKTAVFDLEDKSVLDRDGRQVLKPSGHGALLENLNTLDGDMVFIKTVDNVLPDRLKSTVCFYKRVLGGLLLELEERIHGYLRTLSSETYDRETIRRIHHFARSELSVGFPPDFDGLTIQEKAAILFGKLNRPVRVCGVVANEGDEGGAPFWVDDGKGVASLRLMEGQEVDRASDEQVRIWKSAPYFNPVDIVCSLRDYRGRPFHLPDFADPRAGFVAVRWHGSRQIKIHERPGLWNGAMAYWNSVFVEVPRITVHPVKSVLDLLSWQHRT